MIAVPVGALLSVENVTQRFGGVLALDNVSLQLDEGEIGGLIGPNGAGKTTLFNVITRLYRPNSGDVIFDGKSLIGVRPHRIVTRGIGRTFQNVAPFAGMTVLETVLVGAHTRSWIADRRSKSEARELLRYLGLLELAERPAAGLPYGTLKRVDLARALVSQPRLLLLDEPAGGLGHEEVADLEGLVRNLRRDFALTVLLVEHHMNFVMSISDQVDVLNFGRKIAEGTPAEIRADPDVIEAYLGTSDAAA